MFFYLLFSPLIFTEDNLQEIVWFIIEYADTVSYIPIDVYDLIQRFFNEIFVSKLFDLLNQNIVKIRMNLLNKLTNNLKLTSKTDDIKRINWILLKLCLMISYKWLQKIKQTVIIDYNNSKTENITASIQNNIMELLFGTFHGDHAPFDLYDEHFVHLLEQFISRDRELNENSEGIHRIRQYVTFCLTLFLLTYFYSPPTIVVITYLINLLLI